MAHFVRHHPPRWEFARSESSNHKWRREAAEKQLAEINKTRVKTSGMWYNDQRYVDQMAPSQSVNPDHLDTFNYRYQVYVRPFRSPKSLTEITSKKCAALYDVKRIAADKVWTPSDEICAHHWSQQPWQVNCCPHGGSREYEQGKNNNNFSLHRLLSVGEACDVLHQCQSLSDVTMCRKTTNDHQGHALSECPIEIDLKCARAKNVANSNKHRINNDSVADLLANQNNNRSVELMKESEVILIDNLKGIAEEDLKDVEDEHEIDTILIILPIFPDFVKEIFCRNNNAEDYTRPECIPGHYRDSVHFSATPNQNEKLPLKRKYEHRTTPCMQMLGHLENHAMPQYDHIDQRQLGRASAVTQKDHAELGTPEIGYLTYKIIGGRQYCEPPPKDYLSMIKLPQHLQEYKEFTRRCPNPVIGRYDRSDPANEMLLPRHQASNTMSASRNPFMYCRNPRHHTLQPLFYQPVVTDNLYWRLPSAAAAHLKN